MVSFLVASDFVAAGGAAAFPVGDVDGCAGWGRADRGLGGVQGEGERPEMVGVAEGVAGGGDADAAGG